MSVELKDEQYGIAMHALRKIATGGETTEHGWRKLTKDELINLARAVCDSWSLPYGQNDSLGQYRADLARIEGEQ